MGACSALRLSMRVEWRPGPNDSLDASRRAPAADDYVSPTTNTTITAPTTITGITSSGTVRLNNRAI